MQRSWFKIVGKNRAVWAVACAVIIGNAVFAQPPGESGPSPAPQQTVPPVEVEAPRVLPPTNAPPAVAPQVAPTPVDASSNDPSPPPTASPTAPVNALFDPGHPTSTADAFDFEGSPLNAFRQSTNLGTGAPVSQLDLPRGTSILDGTRIREDSADQTPELFDGLPGVLIQRTNLGGGSLIIRGRNGNQNLIMVDGVPINDTGWRFANVQYLNTIDPGLIQRIEILRGPESVLYGSGAIGGVVNIITKRRTDFSQPMGMNGGIISNYDTAFVGAYNRVTFQGNYGKLGVYGGASQADFGSLYAGQGINVNNTDYDQFAADLRFDYQLNEFWVATWDYQHLQQHDVPRTDRFPVLRPTIFDPQQREFGYGRLAYFNENSRWMNGLTATVDLQRRKERETELRLDRADRRNDVTLEDLIFWGVDLRAFTNLTDKNTLTYGVTYEQDFVSQAERLRTPRAGRFANITTRIQPGLPPHGRYLQFGVFCLDRWQILDWLALDAGVRYSNINASGEIPTRTFKRSFDVWSAETGAVVKLTKQVNWYASIAQGFRAPNLEDLAASDRSTGTGQDFGSTGLAPEVGWNYETGIKWQADRFAGAVSAYNTELFDLIARVPLPGGNNLRGNFAGNTLGTELDFYYLLFDNVSLFAAGTYLWGQNTVLDEPLRVPPAYLSLGSRWTAPRQKFWVEAWEEMMSNQARLGAVDRNDIRVPPGGEHAWQTLNARCGFNLGRYGTLTCGLYNIFDQNYRVLGSGIDAPGIDFRVGYDATY